MISLRRLRALVVKEFYQIIRDPSSILISAVLPAILLFIYGYGISLDYKHLRLGFVMEDSSPEVQSFARSFINSPYFDVHIGRSQEEFYSQIIKGELHGVVVVPSYFSSFRKRPSCIAPIQVIADGSDPNTASFIQNYVQGAFSNWLAQMAESRRWKGLPLLKIQPRYWFNDELESRYFLIPGSLALIATLIGTLLTSLVVAREWERGTMEALMATPVRIVELVLGKLLSYFALGLVSFILSVTLSLLLFGLPLRGSVLVLLCCASVFLWTALGLGLLISTTAKNQFAAAQIALITAFLPAFMLSGFIFEISSMPLPIQILTYFIPARYFVSCLQTLFLVGNVWPLLLKNMLAMMTIGLLFFLWTARKTVKRLE